MDSELEIYRTLRTSQDKYTYFLLAAAGAAIALSINQTQHSNLTWSQLPLALAVLAWGVSFFCGCRHLGYVNSSLYANHELIRVQSGRHPDVGTGASWIMAASEGIKAAMESNGNKANSLGNWQFRLLVTGAVFFIGWHVLEMYLRPILTVPTIAVPTI